MTATTSALSPHSKTLRNDAIDTPFSSTQFFDALLENEEYSQRYHQYLNELVEKYVNGGSFDEFYTRTRSQIDSLVQTDPSAFYTYDEYTAGVLMAILLAALMFAHFFKRKRSRRKKLNA